MNGYTFAWIMWLAMFAVIEVAALFRKAPGDTLSEHVWSWFAIRNKPAGWVARRIVLVVFLVWLVAHFVTGGAV